MQYSLNLECYRDAFSVPNSIVNQHLKLAGALQLKVLLWVCGHKGYCSSVDEIAGELGATPSDVQDALQYWICNDIICPMEKQDNNSSKEVNDTIPKEPLPSPAVLVKATTQVQKPNRREVAKRSNESPEISWLMCEAQNKFKRTLSFAESSTLIWLMDTYGLSPAIILMVIEYALSIDKCNIKFIESTAVKWANNEIDTVEKAEEHLTQIEQSRNDWHLICRLFGIEKRKPTKSEETYIHRWLHVWSFSSKMLQCAYDSCVNNTGKINFAYINTVLNNWFDADFKKPSDIVDDVPASKKSGGKKQLKSASENKNTSYSIDELEKLI